MILRVGDRLYPAAHVYGDYERPRHVTVQVLVYDADGFPCQPREFSGRLVRYHRTTGVPAFEFDGFEGDDMDAMLVRVRPTWERQTMEIEGRFEDTADPTLHRATLTVTWWYSSRVGGFPESPPPPQDPPPLARGGGVA